MIQTAIKLAKLANLARRENRLDDAHRDLVEAVALCRQASADRELVQALKALGQIERDQGNGEAARLLYEEAVAICRGQDDPLTLAHTVRHLGDVHLDAGRMELAEPHYDEALVVLRSQEKTHPCELANAIRPLAILKDATGKGGDARRLWEEARGLYEAAGVQEGVDECSERLTQSSD